MSNYTIRLARPSELERLQRVEDEAGALFAQAGLPADLPGLPLELLREGQRAGLLWVVAPRDEPPVGFALCWQRPGALHLRELDVLPDHGRRGLGARLLERVSVEASTRGLHRVSLTTFAEVPWNARYYERHGFVRIDPSLLPPWLSAIRREEHDTGLDRWPRVAMMRATLQGVPTKSEAVDD